MTTTNWRAFLQPYLDTWKSQGRNAEQIYGVENFLSGQGQLGIEQLLSSAHQQWVDEQEKMLLEVSKVYDHVTGGLLSKPDYTADVVIQAHDERCHRFCVDKDDYEAELKEAKSQWVSEVVERLEGLKMVPTKHEGCYFDDNWCYVHKEIVDRENGEGPNGALQNNRTLDAAISVIQSTTKGE